MHWRAFGESQVYAEKKEKKGRDTFRKKGDVVATGFAFDIFEETIEEMEPIRESKAGKHFLH